MVQLSSRLQIFLLFQDRRLRLQQLQLLLDQELQVLLAVDQLVDSRDSRIRETARVVLLVKMARIDLHLTRKAVALICLELARAILQALIDQIRMVLSREKAASQMALLHAVQDHSRTLWVLVHLRA